MPSQKHTRFTPTVPQTSGHVPVLKLKTHVKAGGLPMNHNETLVPAPRPAATLWVKTRIKAGIVRLPPINPPGLWVKTYIKAGSIIVHD